MKQLIVKTTRTEVIRTITQIVYSYEFKDEKGFKVRGENIGTEKDLLKEIEFNTKKIKDYDVKIVKA